MTSIRGPSRPEAHRFIQPNQQAGTNRGRLELGSIGFHTLRLAKTETGNRVNPIRGRSRLEANHFRNWFAGIDRGATLSVVAPLSVPGRLLGLTYRPT